MVIQAHKDAVILADAAIDSEHDELSAQVLTIDFNTSPPLITLSSGRKQFLSRSHLYEPVQSHPGISRLGGWS